MSYNGAFNEHIVHVVAIRLSTVALIFHDINMPMIIQVGPLWLGLLRTDGWGELHLNENAYIKNV